jgi:hypothetical protein
MYYIAFRDEFAEWNDLPFKSSDLRKATTEARDLQRILDKEKKDAGAYYAVLSDADGSIIYSAYGY